MFRQVLIASTAQGLDPARSGYCQVAGHPGLPRDLLTTLEAQTSTHADEPGSIDFSQTLQAGHGSWFVLGRITGRQPDYTGRPTAFGHFLAIPLDECPAPPKAEACFNAFTPWLSHWEEAPKAFGDEELWQAPTTSATAPAQSNSSDTPFRLGDQSPPSPKLVRLAPPRVRRKSTRHTSHGRNMVILLAVILSACLLFLILK